jgi:hypothetical protein
VSTASADTTWTEAERAELLKRHQPYLLYDALEVYFADDASEWTRNPSNVLVRSDGKRITPPELTLDYLGPAYPDGVAAVPTDYIACTDPHYDGQYFALRRDNQDVRNVIYGRAVERPGELWLEYWFWYFLNDYQLAFDIGVHEGDWEMIQLRIPRGEPVPDVAVYAQHSYCELRPWDEVHRLPEELQRQGKNAKAGDEHRPLVYVGRGSHASFFEPGYHETDFYDLCDGKQPVKSEMRLKDVSEEPAWLRWPGHWGSTQMRYKGPDAPCRHAQFDEPEKLLDKAREVHRTQAPGAPRLDARQDDDRLVVEFDASRCQNQPVQLIVTVNCSDEKAEPPRAFRIDVADLLRAELRTRIPVERSKHYDIRLATVDHDQRPSPAVIFLFAPPNVVRQAIRGAGGALGHVVYTVRRALGIDYGRRSDAPLA